MKILNFFIAFLLLIACQNSPVKAQDKNKTLVGIIEGDSLILTVDKEKIVARYAANLLKQSGIDARFTDVSLKTNSENQQFLIFKGETYTSSFIVTVIGSNLYASNGISCTTSACSSEAFGCTPRSNEVACLPCSNRGGCTKTVSSVSLLD